MGRYQRWYRHHRVREHKLVVEAELMGDLYLTLHPMKLFIFPLALALFGFISADAHAEPNLDQHLPADIGKRLADQVPKPIPTPIAAPMTTASEKVFKHFTTWQGVSVAAITLVHHHGAAVQ
jgi:hypothetical protein